VPTTSDAALRRLYLKFNRQYWEGALPDNTRVLWVPVAGDRVAETCKMPDGTFEIKLSPSVSGFPRFYKWLLIHEMAHIPTWQTKPDHGRLWKQEVLRVLAAGAIRYL